MKKSLPKKFIKISIWIAIITLISFGVLALDVFVLQKHTILWISNYSEIILEIWATQATIASLTLASTAFILGKIEDFYYGISIKELLHLSKRFPAIGLSFWDKNICSIIISTITLIFVVIDNIAVVTVLFILTVYFAVSILYECINVITKSEIYSNWAKKILDNLVNTITSDNDNTDKKQKEIAKKQLCLIIDGIQKEISIEINKKANLHENDTYWYFVRLMDSYTDEMMLQINEQMHDILIDWLILSINVKSEPNIRTLFRFSYPKSLMSRNGATGINIFMSSYYNGDLSTSLFNSEIDCITKDILQAHNDYSAKALYVIRNAINNADEKTLTQILKAVWRSHPYDNPQIRSNVIVTTITYLYYMAFKEQYMPIEKGYSYIDKLRSFINTTFLESYRYSHPQKIRDILSNTELILNGVSFLLEFFNDKNFNWEFISYGEVKSARLENDTIEFLTFYCYLYLKHANKEDFESFPLEVLLKMKEFLNDDGTINEKYSDKYIEFCKWLGKENETTKINDEFNVSIIEAIKGQMFSKAKEIREKRDVWTKKINNMRSEIFQHLSKSHFYKDKNTFNQLHIKFRYSDFHLLNDFSEDCALYGNEQVINTLLENWLFQKLFKHRMFNRVPIHNDYKNFENDVKVFSEELEKMREKGLQIDQYYNFGFFNRYQHKEKSPQLLKEIEKFNSLMKKAGKWSTNYYGVSIYTDSSHEKIGFWILGDNSIKMTEELTEAELRYNCQKYKTKNGFIFKEFSNSVSIPFSEEELMEYLKIAMVKIRYEFPVELPKTKIGFFTYMVE
ncbi:MAG: hypothetical protein IKB93_01250 [Clostridia bacterium]|nr:hypothetical protein [Clostridia bacterium]